MSWAKYAENQTKQVIAQPGVVISAMLMFAFIAGGNLPELLDTHRPHTTLHLVGTLACIFFSIWSA